MTSWQRIYTTCTYHRLFPINTRRPHLYCFTSSASLERRPHKSTCICVRTLKINCRRRRFIFHRLRIRENRRRSPNTNWPVIRRPHALSSSETVIVPAKLLVVPVSLHGAVFRTVKYVISPVYVDYLRWLDPLHRSVPLDPLLLAGERVLPLLQPFCCLPVQAVLAKVHAV